MDLITLANKFEKVANDFFKFIEKNGLEKTIVEMGSCDDERQTNINLCDTPACHGGWAAMMYEKKMDGEYDYSDFFELGAEALAGKLGFNSEEEYEMWAHENPLLWGNDKGNLMFCSFSSFGKTSQENLTLTDIANHYKAVAERIRKSLGENHD